MKIMHLYKKLRKNTSKIFITFWISYIIILVIPLVIGSIAYSQAGKALEDEVLRSNKAMLGQLSQIVDSRLSEINQLADQIALSPNIRQYMYTTAYANADLSYKAIDIINELTAYKNVTKFVDDFYIYFPSNDTILTSTSKYTPETFYSTMYSNTDSTFDNWLNDTLQQQHYRKYMEQKVMFSGNKNTDTLAYIQTIPVNWQGGAYANVVILIDKQKFIDLLKNLEIVEGGKVYLLDQSDNVIASNDGSSTISAELLNLVNEKDGISSGKIDKNDIIISSTVSQQTKWKCVVVTPRRVLMQRVELIRTTTLRMVIICIILGIICSGFLSYRNYNPLRRLTMHLKELFGEQQATVGNDEYGFIQSVMQRTINKNMEIQQQILKHKPVLKVDILRKLLKGQMDDYDRIKESLDFCNIVFTGECFVVVLLYIDSCEGFIVKNSEQEWNLVRFAIANVLEEGLAKFGTVYSIDLEKKEQAVLINFEDNSEDEKLDNLYGSLYELQVFLNEQCKIHTSISIGEIRSGITGINDSYHQAVRAMNYRILKGADSIVKYRDICNYEQSYYYPMEVETKLINSIKSGQNEGALSLLDSIYNENFHNRNLNFYLVRCLFFDMMSTIVKVLNDINVNFKDVSGEDFDPIEQLYHCESMEQMYEIQRDIIRRICLYINSNKKSHNEGIKDKIIEFIEKNYSNPDLGLNLIAENIGITNSYLSYFFKSQVGINITNYINNIRIYHAKELLSKDNYSIAQVAQKIGLSNDIALIRLFKKVEGVTPGKFRETLNN